MAASMPRSPVADGARQARPEWRQYLGAIETAITALEALGLDNGPIQVIEALKARVAVVKARIDALPDLASNPHERLVMWRGLVLNSQGAATFEHGLGTRNVWWQIRDLANGGNVIGAAHDVEVDFSDEAAIRMHVGTGTFDALFYGVISDRY